MTSPQGPVHIGILILIISTTATAGKECKLGCSGSPGNVFKYETGTTYKYKLEGTTLTKVSGSPNDVSKLKIFASADVSALPNCVYSLKLSNVQLVGQDGKKYSNAKELESQPIKFSMNNGRVGSELCTDKDESFTSLNIKRSIISLLQSSGNKDSFATQHETDVFGSCPTVIDVLQSGNDVTVKKSRDLNRCAYREGINVPFLSSGYFTESDFQSTPFFESAKLYVEQKVSSGVVKSATAQEHYEYRPAPSVQSGVKVTVTTKLTLESQAKAPPAPALGMQSRTIIFESPHESGGVSNAKTVLEALRTTCNDIDPVVGENGAKNFAKVVKALSQSKKADILQVYADVKNGAGFKNKDTAMDLFMDALFHAGSGESVEVMAELIADKKVTGSKAKLWLISFGVVKRATKASLKAVLPLLKGDDVSSETYLGVGALAGKFCKEHSCVDVPEVAQLEAKLAAPLMAGCKPTSLDAEDHLIASLKGLGNVHYLSPNVLSKLCECANDKSVRNRVRVAALDTAQSDPNKDVVIKTASNILKNINEDSEVRIKAYLVLVQVPSGKTAELIKDVLDKEKINQVGGFIVSHLRNLRASTNPDKADAKHHFGAIRTTQRFPVDIRKYSLNHELSYSLDSLNLGASGEANVIYSQQSYIPRSVSLNLTTQLFGHSVNLFEVDARVENLETPLEKWLGPKGEHTRLKPLVDGLEAKLKKLREKIEQKYENTIRPKRGVTRAQLEALEKQVVLSNDVLDEIADIDVSLKMFGIEVAWFNHHSNEKLPTPESIIDKLFGQLDNAIEAAKNIDVDYKRHSTFLNSDFSYPTSLGLPLKITLQGNSALRLKFDGKLDIPSIMKDPKNANIRFQIIPSAAVELSATLVVDGGLVESGVKTKLNINTATGTDLTLRLLNGHGFDVKLGLPVKTQDIVTFSSEMVSITAEKGQLDVEKKIEFNVARKGFSVCFDQLEEYIGLTFCGEASVPMDGLKMLTPSNGPSRIHFKIEKEDKLSIYHFKVHHKTNAETGVSTFDLILDTPNSKVVRTLNLQLEGGLNPKTFLKVNAVSPWKKLNFEGSLANDNKEKIIYGKLVIDGEEEYVLKTGATVSGDGPVKKYQPIFEYKAPEAAGKPGLIGRHGAKQGQSYSVSGVITTSMKDNNEVFTFKDLALNTPRSKYVVNGNLMKGTKLVGSDLKITYGEYYVTIKGKFDNQKENKIESYLEVIPSQLPDFGASIKWNYEHTKTPQRSHTSELVIVHGSDPNSQDARVTIKNYMWQNVNGDKPAYNDVKTKNSVTYPVLNIEGVLNAAIEPKAASYEVKASFDRYTAGSKLNAKTGIKKPLDYNIDFAANLMENSVQLQAKRDVVDADKSKLTNSLEISPGRKYQLNAIVVHKLKKDDLNLRVDSEIKFPVDKVLKVVAGLKDNKDESSSELKVTAEKVLINTVFNLKKTPVPSGNYKIALPGTLVTSGDFTLDKGHFKGQAQVDLVKAKRKMDAKADINVAAPKYVGVIDVCWDKSNPKKSVQIKTDSLFDKNEFNTKNTVVFEGYQTQLNANGKVTHANSILSMTCEGEVILPSSRHVSGKFSHSINTKPDNSEVEVFTELKDVEKKGDSPRKVSLKVAGKRINLAKLQFDGQVTLGYETPDKKNLNVNTNLKKVPSGDNKWTINGEVSAGGSLLKNPVSGKLESEVSDAWFTGKLSPDHSIPPVTYHLTGSLGPELSLDSNGKLSGYTVSGDVTIKTNLESVKTFKWTTNNVLDVIPRKGSKLKFKTNNVINHGDNKFIKLNTELNEEEQGANFKLDMESDQVSKRSLNGAVHIRPSTGADPCRGDASLAVAWGDKSSDLTVKVEVGNDKNSASVHLIGTSPENQKFDILVRNKLVRDRLGVHSEAVITVDGKKMTGSGKMEFIQDHPVIDLVLDSPEGKSKFLWRSDKKGEQNWASELKLKWTMNGGGAFALDHEVNLYSIENFVVKLNIDSPTLKVDRYHVDLGSKGQKILINVKSGDKNIVSGSTTYDLKKSGTTSTVTGSGSIKVKEEEFPLSFTATRETIEGGEKMKLSAEAGKYTLNLDTKFTPTEFSIQRTYCKDVKVCKTLKLQSVIKESSLKEYEQDITLLVDLSSLSKSLNDISLKSHSKRNGWLLDQSMEFQWSPTGKIQHNVFVHETNAGASLALPKRTIAAELNYELPKDNKGGRLKLEGNLWLDKLRSPNKKTQILLLNEVNVKNAGVELMNEAKFSHPSLSKDLGVKSKLVVNNMEKGDKPLVVGSSELDIFQNPSQALKVDLKVNLNTEKDGYNGNSVLTIKSVGCKLDLALEQKLVATKKNVVLVGKGSYVNSKGVKREAVVKTEVTPQKVYMLAKLPDVKLLEVTVKMNTNKEPFTATGTMELLGSTYKETISLDKSPILNYQLVFSKEGGEKVLDINAGVNKNGELKVTFDKGVIAEVNVDLSENNFLKTDYNYNYQNAKNLYNNVVLEAKGMEKQVEKSVKNLVDQGKVEAEFISKNLVDALPNLNPLFEAYQGQLTAMKEEIVSDETLSKIVEDLNESLSTVIERVVVILEQYKTFYTELVKIVTETLHKLEVVLKDSMPKIEKSIGVMTKTVVGLLEDLTKFALTLVDALQNELKKHEADIKVVVDAVAEYVQEYGKILRQLFRDTAEEIRTTWEIVVEQIRDLPIFDIIKEKLEELKAEPMSEEIKQILKTVATAISEACPTDELTMLVDKIVFYIEEVCEGKPIDKVGALKDLSSLTVSAVKSVVDLVASIVPEVPKLKLENLTFWPSLAIKIPTGALRTSLFHWLQSSDFPTLEELLSSYITSLNPLDYVPPFRAEGAILGGTEVVTFDGRHISFKGACSYVVAEDYKNNNFSLVAEIGNGKLESLTLTDKNDILVLRADKKVSLNGKEVEFPAIHGNLRAWKRDMTMGAVSSSGMFVICSNSLKVCYVSVSGYYFNRLRGLMGIPNNEPYDDTTLPKGKVTEDVAEFGNSWKVDPSCPNVPSAPYTHNRDPKCTEYFTSNNMELCYYAVNPKPFRDSCDHLAGAASTPEAKAQAACSVAMGYIYICQFKGIPLIQSPASCVTCKAGDKTVKYGEEMTVTTPGKSADVVFLVEQVEPVNVLYARFIKPLVPALTQAFKDKGIGDVKFGLVGYGEAATRPFSSFFTVNGQLGYDGTTNAISFDKEKITFMGVGDLIDFWKLRTVDRHVGTTFGDNALKDIMSSYPFRSESVKTVIGLHGGSCSPIHSPVASLNRLLNLGLMKMNGVIYNHIPLIAANLSGQEPPVGYNKYGVFTLSDAKQPTLKSNSELLEKLSPEQDSCAELVLAAKGNVFFGQNLYAMGEAKQGDAVTVIAKRVAETLTDKTQTLKCTCGRENGLAGKQNCVVTESVPKIKL